jgi:hypothetical protein
MTKKLVYTLLCISFFLIYFKYLLYKRGRKDRGREREGGEILFDNSRHEPRPREPNTACQMQLLDALRLLTATRLGRVTLREGKVLFLPPRSSPPLFLFLPFLPTFYPYLLYQLKYLGISHPPRIRQNSARE